MGLFWNSKLQKIQNVNTNETPIFVQNGKTHEGAHPLFVAVYSWPSMNVAYLHNIPLHFGGSLLN